MSPVVRKAGADKQSRQQTAAERGRDYITAATERGRRHRPLACIDPGATVARGGPSVCVISRRRERRPGDQEKWTLISKSSCRPQ